MGEGFNPAAVSTAVSVVHLARVSHWGPEEVMGSVRGREGVWRHSCCRLGRFGSVESVSLWSVTDEIQKCGAFQGLVFIWLCPPSAPGVLTWWRWVINTARHRFGIPGWHMQREYIFLIESPWQFISIYFKNRFKTVITLQEGPRDPLQSCCSPLCGPSRFCGCPGAWRRSSASPHPSPPPYPAAASTDAASASAARPCARSAPRTPAWPASSAGGRPSAPWSETSGDLETPPVAGKWEQEKRMKWDGGVRSEDVKTIALKECARGAVKGEKKERAAAPGEKGLKRGWVRNRNHQENWELCAKRRRHTRKEDINWHIWN